VPTSYGLNAVDFRSHYIVPELEPGTKFALSSRKAVDEYKEAKAVSFCDLCDWIHQENFHYRYMVEFTTRAIQESVCE
jgi:hypothetical protein